jgi:hypothetical protein
MKATYIISSLFALTLLGSCRKFVEVDTPYTLTGNSTVFSDNTSATAAQVGIYINMQSLGVPYSVARNTGTYGDELVNYYNDEVYNAMYTNALTPLYSVSEWSSMYQLIYGCNAVLEGVTASNTLGEKVKAQLTGEAEFTRAYLYFYLVNLYSEVPLITSTDYKVNSTISRSPVTTVYEQIIGDLKDAEAKLNADFVDMSSENTTTDRIRPSKWAARALLARVYLYLGDYANAVAMSSLVIENSAQFSLSNIDEVFLANSTEAIWQLQIPANLSFNSEGSGFIMTYLNPYYTNSSSALSASMLAAFEVNDARKSHWVGLYSENGTDYYYPYKYKEAYTRTPTEASMMLRLAEQYLIRAEAYAQQDNVSAAIEDLNKIRHRADLGDYAGAEDKTDVLASVYHERQVELFSEWGHRWFDIKRRPDADVIMTAAATAKGGVWASYKKVWPVMQSERDKNKQLSQNDNY